MSSSSYNPNITLTSLSTQQGEINLVTNPIAQFDANNWTTSSATLTRSSTGVLSPVIPTGFTASSTTSTTSYVQTSLLTVPATLRNRKLKVQLYIQCADTATWKVDVLKSDGSTRYTLSTDSSGVSALPALTGTYTTTFDMDTGSGIYVRLTRYAGSGTSTLSFTNLIVGPGIQPQGFAGQEWQAYSLAPTGGGSATFTYINRQFRRLGDSIEVYYVFSVGSAGSGTTAVTIPLPTNLNIDYTKAANETRLGSYSFLTTNYAAGGSIRSVTGVPTGVQLQEVGAATLITGADLTAGSAWYISFTAPIAEFSGSGTVQLAQNDTEWAYNTSTATAANDLTSFAYGPQGAAIQALTAQVIRRVRFQTPIQVSDSLVVEIKPSTGSQWFAVGSTPQDSAGTNTIVPRLIFNTFSCGIGCSQVNATDVDVIFGLKPSTGGATSWGDTVNTYAWGTGTNPPSGWSWRVRKSSAGAAVGFGIVQPGVSSGLVSASGVPGNTTGNTIATGFFGEQRLATSTTAVTTGGVAVNSLSITPGVWMLSAITQITADATAREVYTAISTTQNTMPAFSTDGTRAYGHYSTSNGIGFVQVHSLYINISVTTTYYQNSSATAVSGLTATNNRFQAVRIA